jgi:TatD DNase family protein
VKIVLIDTHCHLHDREFFSEEEAEACLKRAVDAGVEKIICIGTSHEDSLAAREFAEKHENVFWTYGVHPENAVTENGTFMFQRRGIRSAAARGKAPATRGDGLAGRAPERNIDVPAAKTEQDANDLLIAIGEIGLDYHYEGYNREKQIRLFEEMLQLAVDHDLPVSFHVREAFSDFFPVVANFPKVRGVVHSFTDSKKVLRRILAETDFYVGVNGLATYSTLPTPPLERILLETDAPFLAPVPHRGGTNEPAFIANIAQWLAQKLEVSETEVARTTTSNVRKLFGI